MRRGGLAGLFWVAASVLLITAVLAVGACSAKKASPTGTTIKIGQISMLSGAFADVGKWEAEGVDLALEEAGYKVAGKKIEFIREDDATDPSVSLAKAKKLIENDKVSILLGPLLGTSGIAVAPYLAQKKVPALASMEGSWESTKSGWYFPTLGTMKQGTRIMGRYAYDVLGHRKAAIIGSDFEVGRDFLNGFAEGFRERGGTIVQEQWPPIEAMDFAPYITALKSADVVASWVVLPGSIRFVKQYDEFGYFKKMPLLSAPAQGGIALEALDAFGDAAIGVHGETDYTWLIDTPENKKFVDAFEKKYKHKPGVFNDGGYRIVKMALAALEATGGDTSNPDNLRKALLSVRLDLPGGSYSIAPNGFGIRPSYIVKVQKQDGKLVYVPVHREDLTFPSP